MSIGTRIIQARNLRNMSQRELSERSGIASSYLSRIENRRLEPRPKTLRRIAEALGVPLSELFREGRAGQAVSRCAITVSGNCIMELLRSRRRKVQRPGIEAFSPRQLQLLRMASYLIQTGNTRLLDTLEVLLSGLLASLGSRLAAGPKVRLDHQASAFLFAPACAIDSPVGGKSPGSEFNRANLSQADMNGRSGPKSVQCANAHTGRRGQDSDGR